MSAFRLRKAVSPYSCDHTIGIRVRIDCDSSEGLSPKIFAYLPGGDSQEHFNHVCTVIDMKECPEDAPSAGKWPKWYRRSYVDLLVPTVEDAYDFIEKVQEDVEDLYKNMKLYNTLISQGEYIVGNANDLPEENNGNNG